MIEIKKFYDDNGYYLPIDAIENTKIDKAYEKLIKLYQNPPKNIKHPWNLQAHLLANWIYELCISPLLLDAVEKVIGPNILIQSADIFIKPAKGKNHINWHQDANYWGLNPYELVTGWIALTDVNLDNGCMSYLPKSHLKNKIEHIETFDKRSDLTRGQEVKIDIDNKEVVPVILKKGQAALHHCLLAHGSGPNLTEFPRIGIAVRYLPTHIKQTKGPPISMILARGIDEYKNFKMDKIPTGDFDFEAIAEHDLASTPHAPSNYATS